MIIFDRVPGRLIFPDHGAYVAYSGTPQYKNNPAYEKVEGGPIPAGIYSYGTPFDSERTGVFVMRLTPMEGTDTFNRDAFELHGDSKKKPGTASKGCIVASNAVRTLADQEIDRRIKVI